MLNIEVQRDDSLSDVQADACPGGAFFELWCQRTVDFLRQGGDIVLADSIEISVLLTSSEGIRVLNRDYRAKDSVTNVLSFPSGLPVIGNSLQALGDIVFCGEVVQKEAESQDKAVLNHWAHLTVHGVLHLAGFDHESDSDASIMEASEIQILSDFGVGNPY